MTNENRSFWENEEKKLDERVYQAMWPGGEKAVEMLIRQGKQPVRELISKLIDPETDFFELGGIAGFGMNYPGVIHSKSSDTTEFKKICFRIDEFADKFPDRLFPLPYQHFHSFFSTGPHGLVNPFIQFFFFVFPE